MVDEKMKGYMYILECSDGSYYTGSTNDLERRFEQHRLGEGSNHTKKRLPVKLVYFEEYHRIDDAFYREKQIQGWSRNKKEALINNMSDDLKKYAQCMNESHYRNFAHYSTPCDTSASSVHRSAPFDSAPFDSAPFDSAQGAQGAQGAQRTEHQVVERNPVVECSPVVERSRNHRYDKGLNL